MTSPLDSLFFSIFNSGTAETASRIWQKLPNRSYTQEKMNTGETEKTETKMTDRPMAGKRTRAKTARKLIGSGL